MLKVYTDAAVNGNPGQAGIGIVVMGDGVYQQIAKPLDGLWDNHLAEFEAIKYAMEWLIRNDHNNQLVFLYSDSKSATDALIEGSTKNKKYMRYLRSIYLLEESFEFITLDWTSEKNNHGADHQARQALQTALKA